jgi:hypothetical protein
MAVIHLVVIAVFFRPRSHITKPSWHGAEIAIRFVPFGACVTMSLRLMSAPTQSQADGFTFSRRSLHALAN